VELFLARDALLVAPKPLRLGVGTAAALAALAEACRAFAPATSTADIVAAVRPLLATTLLEVAEAAAGS